MTTMVTSVPLAATLADISALDGQYLSTTIGGVAPGWFPANHLVGASSPALEEGLERQRNHYPCADRRTCGSFFINIYAWYVFAPAIAAYLVTRRVPDLAPANMALQYRTYTWEEAGETGESERIDVRFLSGRFATLPDDPDADHPDALVLSNLAALRDWLRAGIEAHMLPLIDQVHDRTHLARRGQWTLVADACAALFLHIGTVLGDPARGQAEGLDVVKAPGSPLRNPGTGYVTLEWQGQCDTFRTRGGCCRYYTLPEGHKCTTCVLRPAEERNQRLLEYMATKFAHAPAGDA